MFVRTFITSLLVLPLLTVVLTPGEAEACSPLIGFTIDRTYPGADAVDVPIDGVVVVVGEGWQDDAAKVELRLGDVPVEGELTQISTGRYVWRSAAPLQPDSVYTAHVEGDSGFEDAPSSVRDFQFTTGVAAAPAMADVLLDSAVVEGFERDVRECVVEANPGECSDCAEWKVVGVEHRMRLVAQIAAPGGSFAGYHAGHLAIGADPEMLDTFATQYEPAGGGNILHTIDLGLAGSWPSDQVCMRPELEDPLGKVAEGKPRCLDISEINQEPPVVDQTTGEPETTGDPETTGSSDSASESGDESGGVDSTAFADDTIEGCGCRSDAGAGWSGLLALIGLVGLRRRRV